MPDDRAIAIAATFTAEAIEPALAFWRAELSLALPVHFAAYNQLFQELLSPTSIFARNHGYNVALIRLDDWLEAGLSKTANEFVDAVRSAGRFQSPLII